MPEPEKHGGGYIPSSRRPLRYLGNLKRSATEQLHATKYPGPRNDTSTAGAGAIGGSRRDQRHESASDHISPNHRYTTNSDPNALPLVAGPNRVNTIHNFRGERHGGGYVPNIARPSLTLLSRASTDQRPAIPDSADLKSVRRKEGPAIPTPGGDNKTMRQGPDGAFSPVISPTCH
jgi:hypothetical protein